MTGLRSAKFSDHWRHVSRGEYPTRYRRLAFRGLRGFQDGEIEFRAGISVIVGGNGVGKSTLAAALAEVVCSKENVGFGRDVGRLRGSDLSGLIQEKDNEVSVQARSTGNEREIDNSVLGAEYAWLEPAALAMRIRFAIQEDSNFAEVLGGAPIRQLDADELAVAGYLVGRTYTEIEVAEVSDYGDLERFPYIRATSEGISYASEAMGLGELCLLTILWKLKDIGQGGVLILEEPENHVSPRSQEALANVLARTSDKKRLWIIAVTHSPLIAELVSLANIRLITRDPAGSVIISIPTRSQISAVLGGAFSVRALVLTEDELGRRFLNCLLAEADLDLLSQMELEVAGGESAVTLALRSVPRSERTSFLLIGVYDGDQRARNMEEVHWPRVFLPGDIGPEGLLRAELLASRSSDAPSMHLGRTKTQIANAIESADGLDDHDWLRRVAETLGLSDHDLTLALIRLWRSNPNNAASESQLIADLRRSLGGG